MKSRDIYKLYDAIYEARFAHKFPQPPLSIYLDQIDDDDPYYGAYCPDEYEIEFVKPMHNNWFEVLDTLVHELVHVDQITMHGRENPETYHDGWFQKRFAKHMKALCEEWKNA